MKINFNMVRFALAAYARKMGRPDYSIAVMRDVHSAIINDVDHHLKSIVLENLENGKNYRDAIKSTQEEDRVQSLMFKVNQTYGLKPALAEVMQISVNQIGRHMSGRTGLSMQLAEEYWMAIPEAMKRIKINHGSNGYNQGCRCELCTHGHRIRQREAARRKKASVARRREAEAAMGVASV